MFDLFKNKKFELKSIEYIDESDQIVIPKTNLKYNGIEIMIGSNKEESLKHIEEDFEVIKNTGIENMIKTNFIPWLKGDNFKDLNDEEIYNGLRLTDISYSYHRFVAKYSPTEQDDYFGEFEFDFESGNDYTENLLQASAFVVLVNKGKVYFGNNFDI